MCGWMTKRPLWEILSRSLVGIGIWGGEAMQTALPLATGLTNEEKGKLWAAADKLRGHLDAAEYKHVVLGLIFLKYISDAFQEKYRQLTLLKQTEHANPEEY